MNREEFKQSILPHYRRMYGIAAAVLGDSEDACDAVQESMARLWEKRDEIGDKNNYEQFCLRVVKNVCLDKIRLRRQYADLSAADRPVSGNDATETRETLNVVRRLVATLGETQRKVFMMATFGEYDNDEIVRATGLSEANVRQLLSRARKRIKELYQSYER